MGNKFITKFYVLNKRLSGGTEERSNIGVKIDFLTFLDAAIWP